MKPEKPAPNIKPFAGVDWPLSFRGLPAWIFGPNIFRHVFSGHLGLGPGSVSYGKKVRQNNVKESAFRPIFKSASDSIPMREAPLINRSIEAMQTRLNLPAMVQTDISPFVPRIAGTGDGQDILLDEETLEKLLSFGEEEATTTTPGTEETPTEEITEEKPGVPETEEKGSQEEIIQETPETPNQTIEQQSLARNFGTQSTPSISQRGLAKTFEPPKNQLPGGSPLTSNQNLLATNMRRQQTNLTNTSNIGKLKTPDITKKPPGLDIDKLAFWFRTQNLYKTAATPSQIREPQLIPNPTGKLVPPPNPSLPQAPPPLENPTRPRIPKTSLEIQTTPVEPIIPEAERPHAEILPEPPAQRAVTILPNPTAPLRTPLPEGAAAEEATKVQVQAPTPPSRGVPWDEESFVETFGLSASDTFQRLKMIEERVGSLGSGFAWHFNQARLAKSRLRQLMREKNPMNAYEMERLRGVIRRANTIIENESRLVEHGVKHLDTEFGERLKQHGIDVEQLEPEQRKKYLVAATAASQLGRQLEAYVKGKHMFPADENFEDLEQLRKGRITNYLNTAARILGAKLTPKEIDQLSHIVLEDVQDGLIKVRNRMGPRQQGQANQQKQQPPQQQQGTATVATGS